MGLHCEVYDIPVQSCLLNFLVTPPPPTRGHVLTRLNVQLEGGARRCAAELDKIYVLDKLR